MLTNRAPLPAAPVYFVLRQRSGMAVVYLSLA